MTVAFTQTGWEDYLYWQQNDPDLIDRINELIKEIKRDPFRGIGKPEPLRGNLTGYWSRRITHEHRFLYKVSGISPNQTLIILQLRFHY